MIKYLFLLTGLIIISLNTFGQSNGAQEFHQAANLYIDGQIQKAKQSATAALRQYPDNEKIRKLLEKMKEEEKKQKQQQNQQKQNQQQSQKQQQQQQNRNQQQQQQSQQQQQQSGQNQQQNQEKQQQENREQQQQEGEQKNNQEQMRASEEDQQQKGDEEQSLDPSTLEKLRQMNISKEKARMILEAMKNNEKQYIQQKRKKSNQRRPDPNKPDW